MLAKGTAAIWKRDTVIVERCTAKFAFVRRGDGSRARAPLNELTAITPHQHHRITTKGSPGQASGGPSLVGPLFVGAMR